MSSSKYKFADISGEAIQNPKTLKSKVRMTVRNTYLTTLSSLNRKDEENFLRCLYCHYVFSDQLRAFEKIISELSNIGKFVSTDAAMSMLKGNSKIEGKNFHLSFDDGFKNNFTNAAPILQKYNVPAIFFVPSAIIDASYDVVKNYCLNTAKYNAVIEIMSWKDLGNLLDLGFEVGSHTRTHARFSDISSNKQLMEDEILGSKYEIENQLNNKCDYISWPYGKASDADDASLKFVAGTEYLGCFGAFRGTLMPKTTDIFKIPRHHFEAHWPLSHIKYFARGNREF